MDTGTEPTDNDQMNDGCPDCAQQRDAGSRFCGACGSDLSTGVAVAKAAEASARPPEGATAQAPLLVGDNLPATVPTAEVTTIEDDPRTEPEIAQARRKIFTKRRVLTSAAVAIALALLTAAILVHLGTRDDLSKTRTELASTQTELSDTEDELADTSSALKDMTTERDGLQGDLEAANAELSGVQSSLDAAEDRVNLQASQISVLRVCLEGVGQALVDVSYFDYSAAISALNSVSSACEQADAFV